MIFSVISQSADIGLALGDDFYSALQYSAASRGFRILAKHMGIDTGWNFTATRRLVNLNTEGSRDLSIADDAFLNKNSGKASELEPVYELSLTFAIGYKGLCSDTRAATNHYKLK